MDNSLRVKGDISKYPKLRATNVDWQYIKALNASIYLGASLSLNSPPQLHPHTIIKLN
jgi:hypothetical protein